MEEGVGEREDEFLSRLQAGRRAQCRDSIPGPWDQTLARIKGQPFNQLSHSGAPTFVPFESNVAEVKSETRLISTCFLCLLGS